MHEGLIIGNGYALNLYAAACRARGSLRYRVELVAHSFRTRSQRKATTVKRSGGEVLTGREPRQCDIRATP